MKWILPRGSLTRTPGLGFSRLSKGQSSETVGVLHPNSSGSRDHTLRVRLSVTQDTDRVPDPVSRKFQSPHSPPGVPRNRPFSAGHIQRLPDPSPSPSPSPPPGGLRPGAVASLLTSVSGDGRWDTRSPWSLEGGSAASL